MNPSPLSGVYIPSTPPAISSSNDEQNLKPIISEKAVENEVSFLSNVTTSITELFEKTKNFVDQNIDAREVMNNAGKIVENLANERDKYLPPEKELNGDVARFLYDLQNEKKDRENVIESFLKDLEESYNSKIKILNTIQNVAEKTVKLEQIAMQFTSIGHKIGETTNLIDETETVHYFV